MTLNYNVADTIVQHLCPSSSFGGRRCCCCCSCCCRRLLCVMRRAQQEKREGSVHQITRGGWFLLGTVAAAVKTGSRLLSVASAARASNDGVSTPREEEEEFLRWPPTLTPPLNRPRNPPIISGGASDSAASVWSQYQVEWAGNILESLWRNGALLLWGTRDLCHQLRIVSDATETDPRRAEANFVFRILKRGFRVSISPPPLCPTRESQYRP